tara:strand:- start:11629 stop:11904 length:276 start_codon:yes stop_codon:yes gene_type:complete
MLPPRPDSIRHPAGTSCSRVTSQSHFFAWDTGVGLARPPAANALKAANAPKHMLADAMLCHVAGFLLASLLIGFLCGRKQQNKREQKLNHL